MPNPLEALLALSEAEKKSRGLEYTPVEIFQQPELWLSTVERMHALRPRLAEFLEGLGNADVLLAGAGTSNYIGRAVSRTLRKHLRRNVSTVPSTELLTNLDDFVLEDRQYLLVSFSRSGESSEGVALLEQAKARYGERMRHLILTCNAEGTMARFPGAFAVVLDLRTNDRGLAMTSSFTSLVIAGQYLAFVTSPSAFVGQVQQVAAIGSKKMGEMAGVAAELAAKRFSRVCFLGTGALQAIAEESALKVLELNAGRIATVAESPLGLRHGPLSYVNGETLVVAYLSRDEYRRRYELDLLEELNRKKLGAEILAVTPERCGRIGEIAKHVVSLDAPMGVADEVVSVVHVMTGQLLGLFFSIANGIQPDSPGTGAISRVVSHVKIYSSSGETA